MMNIPDDADGDAMRRVLALGADLTRPMTIDFQIDCPDLASGEAIAAKISALEFAIRVYQDPEDAGVTCECSRRMLLEYSELVRIQGELSDIARPFGGWCEAWGTSGNMQTTEPGTAPNVGPTASSANSDAGKGPPSVS